MFILFIVYTGPTFSLSLELLTVHVKCTWPMNALGQWTVKYVSRSLSLTCLTRVWCAHAVKFGVNVCEIDMWFCEDFIFGEILLVWDYLSIIWLLAAMKAELHCRGTSQCGLPELQTPQFIVAFQSSPKQLQSGITLKIWTLWVHFSLVWNVSTLRGSKQCLHSSWHVSCTARSIIKNCQFILLVQPCIDWAQVLGNYHIPLAKLMCNILTTPLFLSHT